MDDNNSIQQTIAALKQDINQARIVAAEPTTNPEILRELALFDDEKTREAVVSNANSPPEVLVQLGEQFPSQFLDNPVFPLLLLENPNFIRELPLNTLRSILTQENCPEYILEQAADKADLEVQLALANNVKTSKAILSRLNQSRNSEVVEAVNLHVNFVGELTEGFEEKVRELVKKIIPSGYQTDIRSLTFVLAQICYIPKFIVQLWVQEKTYMIICRELAEYSATAPNILECLANHTDSYTRVRLAKNHNTPTETLLKLANEQPSYIARYVAMNPSTTIDLLEILSKREDKELVHLVAQNPNTPLPVLQELAKDVDRRIAQSANKNLEEQQDEYDEQAVRKNPEISPEILEKFAQKDPETVAELPYTPPKLLLKLFQNVDEKQKNALDVYENIASNPNTPASILEQLARNESSFVRQAVARNSSTPINVLFKHLARDVQVSWKIAKMMSAIKSNEYVEKDSILDIFAEESTSSLEKILQRLIQEGSSSARLFLARRFDLPTDLLAKLAHTSEVKVCEAVAQNPNTSISTLDKLAQSLELEVRQAIAQNPNTSINALEKLAQSSETEIRQLVAQNPNTPINVLEKLAKDKDSKVRMHIASNNKLPSQILDELANDESFEVFTQAFRNSCLSKKTVERILCGQYASYYFNFNPDYLSYYPNVKASVINHYANVENSSIWFSLITLIQPEITQELLHKKSISICWLERFAVAMNKRASQIILNQLAEDCNQLVRAAAKDTITSRA